MKFIVEQRVFELLPTVCFGVVVAKGHLWMHNVAKWKLGNTKVSSHRFPCLCSCFPFISSVLGNAYLLK